MPRFSEYLKTKSKSMLTVVLFYNKSNSIALYMWQPHCITRCITFRLADLQSGTRKLIRLSRIPTYYNSTEGMRRVVIARRVSQSR